MIQKFVLGTAVAGLMLSAVSARPLPAAQQNPPQQAEPRQNEQAKSASGKVTEIAKDKRSFSVKQNSGNSSDSSQSNMVFIINGETQVKGQVTVGTDVDVEYRTTPDGNLALVISPKTSGGGSH